MNNIQQDLLNSTAQLYFQFQDQFSDKKSLLFDDIMIVLGCSKNEAKSFASTYCNIVSWWLLNFSQGFTNFSFQEYLKKMLNTQVVDPETKKLVYCCDEHGYFNTTKDVIAPAIFNYSFTPEYFEDFEDIVNPSLRMNSLCGYQMKMKGDTHGFHFMSTYIDNSTGLFMGVDTSYRGTPFILTKYINEKNFQWLMKVK